MPGEGGEPANGWQLTVDREHGGRWTSLVDPSGRDWLWSRPDPARNQVGPGSSFIDVGGVEECYPTINGHPDHGDIWTRSWRRIGDGAETVHSGATDLTRHREVTAEHVQVDYQLNGPPATTFLWAAHMLITPVLGLRLEVPAGWPAITWPVENHPRVDRWPGVAGITDFDVIGPDDGSAILCLLPGLDTITARIGDERLRVQLHNADQPVSIAIWRNLGGFSADDGPPYRSLGVEPLLGRHSNRSAATSSELATLPTSGTSHWQLTIDNAATENSGGPK